MVLIISLEELYIKLYIHYLQVVWNSSNCLYQLVTYQVLLYFHTIPTTTLIMRLVYID